MKGHLIMSDSNRTCKVCGKTYHYCPTCPRDSDKPAWMTRFDSSTCKQLWDILVANGNGESTDQETVQKLNQLNYKSLNIENEGIKAHIARLTGNTPQPSFTKEEIRNAVTADAKEVKTDILPNKKVAPSVNTQQVVNAAANEMHKKNGFKFLNSNK